jgi:flavin reductase (DIM6/NTAB) family NADH-FMN oxidoreductase RutF
MEKTVSHNIGAFYQHYPRLAVVVTAGIGGRDNAMTIAWHAPVSKSPPLFGVAASAGHFTTMLIDQSREFGVNFLPDTSAELVAAIGGSKGKDTDKFKALGIEKVAALETAVPVLKDAYAAFECKLVDDQLYGDHKWLVGEIVAVHYAQEFFLENGTLDLAKIGPALYMGSELYLDIKGCKTRCLDREQCVRGFQA